MLVSNIFIKNVDNTDPLTAVFTKNIDVFNKNVDVFTEMSMFLQKMSRCL